MQRSRLLVVVPATAALVFTGLSPAWAYDDHNGGTSAEVLSIDDDARANEAGTKVDVTFEYRCDGDARDIDVEVTLVQPDGDIARFEEDFKGRHRLVCDNLGHDLTVTLKGRGDRLRNDDAEVTVRFDVRNGDDDSLTDDVDVSGVGA